MLARTPSARALTPLLALLICSLGLLSRAQAGVEHWELSEVHLQSQSDSSLRFVELVNLQGGCLFPSSTLSLYGADGALIDVMALASVTTCFGAPTYLLLAGPNASDFFGVDSDLAILSELPSSGQLCFASSATRYDCVRWGTITTPIVDLFGSTDLSVASAPPDGLVLARVQSTHVVVDDWMILDPTPRAPNDGSPWTPPDAGPLPDAGSVVDAGPLFDAARRPDSGPPPDARPDARNTRYLDLDPVGGGDCGCAQGRGGTGLGSVLVSAIFLLGLRRGRRRSVVSIARRTSSL